MKPHLTLTEEQRREAIRLGTERQNNNSNVIEQKQDDMASPEQIHIDGAAGEIALCTYLGIDYDHDTRPRSGGHDAWYRGMSIDVKTCIPYGNLIIQPSKRDHPSDIYVLLRGNMDSGYELAGYATKDEAFKTMKEFKGKMKYFVPVSKLHDIEELNDITAPRSIVLTGGEK